jgi:hypothetical protein
MDTVNTLSELQLRQGIAAANAAIENLRPGLGEIMQTSVQEILKLDKQHFARLTAEMLHIVRSTSLEHASPPLLRDLIVRCVVLCRAIELHHLGGAPESDIVAAVSALVRDAATLNDAVMDEIERGRLGIEDPKRL